MQKITTFLWFDKEAEEAMNLYVSIFNGAPGSRKNSKIVNIKRYPEGITEGPMKGMDGKVLTGVFELDGQQFLCLDGGPLFKPNESISLSVDCDGQEEVDYFWEKFTADGGQESMCGWLKDKFGFSWQIIPRQLVEMLEDEDKEKSGRALQCMLGQKKIDIAELKKAFDGK